MPPSTAQTLIHLGPQGLTVPGRPFHIDAWKGVEVNLLTHAHSDHARIGSAEYWCTEDSAPVVRHRLGPDIKIVPVKYGERHKIGDCWVSFHSAGHVLGSAQVRVEKGSKVWVVSGDYKRDPDPSCAPFEVVECDGFITEATFGLPIYEWESSSVTAQKILGWWTWCKQEGLTALLFCYAFGKSQRVLAQIRAIEHRKLALVKEAQEPERPRSELPFGSAPLWEAWFSRNGWEPYKFQRETWAAYARGESGVIGVPTGSGKTYAVLGGELLRMLGRGAAPGAASKLRMLYIAPLKALARDVAGSLERPFRELDLPFSVGIRTGDTDTIARAKLKKGLPKILVTTPESLALLTAEINWRERFSSLECIVVDEWHELLGTKRGSLLELTLARLRACVPEAQTWALSATLGNLSAAGAVAAGREGVTVIRDNIVRETEIRAILPKETIPWFGTAALRLKQEPLEEIDPRESTILFTNTRSQAELWFNTLLAERPEWEELIALHHGSLAREERERVEAGVKAGEIKVVVATSSLDLGVDFPHVSKVIQVGSVKTVTRALQRGGRSAHTLGRKSRLVILPTTLFDLVETGALREALRLGALETREPLPQPADVLLQFLLNSAFEGYGRTEITAWVRGAWSFRGVTGAQINWGLDFLSGQGKVLRNNADFRKLECIDDKYRFSSPRLARLHRLNIGTIVASGEMSVQFLSGKKLGTVDEQFLTRLKKGDVFQFSGKALQIVQVRDMVVYVRLTKSKRLIPAVWNGQVLPVSRALSDLTRAECTHPSEGSEPERRALGRLIALQALRSHVPREDEILIEQWRTKSGYHTFLYLFEGRLVHEGLGHLLAYRLSRVKPNTISVSANDQGLELLSTEPLGDQAGIFHALSNAEGLASDIESSLNFPELVKRAFREVARVAGLVQQAVPGLQKSVRQVQMSTGLLYEVFLSHDPGNPPDHGSTRASAPRAARLSAPRASRAPCGREPARVSPARTALALFAPALRRTGAITSFHRRARRPRGAPAEGVIQRWTSKYVTKHFALPPSVACSGPRAACLPWPIYT